MKILEFVKSREIFQNFIFLSKTDFFAHFCFRNDEQLIKFKGKRIHIKEVFPSNNGVYRCRAHNEAATVESKINFSLKIPDVSYPQVKVLPEDVLAKKGTTVRFDCSFDNCDYQQWNFKSELLKNDGKR